MYNNTESEKEMEFFPSFKTGFLEVFTVSDFLELIGV